MTKITEHFYLEEMCRSNTAIRKGLDNTCPPELFGNMLRVCEALEHIRAYYGSPITITSCYRSPAVNKAVGGSKTSAHRFANAVDFEVDGVSNRQVVKDLPKILIDFDQIIYEFGEEGWVHLGFAAKNRKQILRADKVEGKTVYSAFI